MMATCRKLRDRSATRKDLRELSNPYERQYTNTQYTTTQNLGRQGKPGNEKFQRVFVRRQKEAVPQKLRCTWHRKNHVKSFDEVIRSLDRKYQERENPRDDAKRDENNEAGERQGDDGETEANRQEGGLGDKILRFCPGVEELLKVLVAGFRKDNYVLKNQAELQNSEYVNQVAVLKDQNETLTKQVEKKTTQCGEVEQIAAQLKNEVQHWKTKFVECAVQLGSEIETRRKENGVLRTEKDSLREENGSLKSEVEMSNTICVKVGKIAARLNKAVELFTSELVKAAERKNQNSSLKDQLAKWKTYCEKDAQPRKDLESQLHCLPDKIGYCHPTQQIIGLYPTPPTTE